MAGRAKTQRYVALLRGINVGGKNLLPMKDLVEIVLEQRCTEVQSYIQSGNILLTAPVELEGNLPAKISKAIHSRFGYKIPVVLRSMEGLRLAVAANPFLTSGAPGVDEKALHVYFLAATPLAEDAAKLDADRGLPDRFALHGREIYLNLPHGMGRTKLTNAYFDAKLHTVSTARNWGTVLKLLALMGG